MFAPSLQNQVLSLLNGNQRATGTNGTTSELRDAHRGTGSGSSLRRYLVDAWDNKFIDEKLAVRLPRQFLLDLANTRGKRSCSGSKEIRLEEHFLRKELERRQRFMGLLESAGGLKRGAEVLDGQNAEDLEGKTLLDRVNGGSLSKRQKLIANS